MYKLRNFSSLAAIVAVTAGLLPSLSHGQTSAIPKGDVVVEHAFPANQMAQAGVSNQNIIMPIEFINFLPCALDGVGEEVALSGTLHVRIHSTVDSMGGFHFSVRVNDQGIEGLGLTSGDRYVGTGTAGFTLNLPSSGTLVCAAVINLGIVGKQAPGILLANFHLTINPFGEVTANSGGLDEARLVCPEDPVELPMVPTCEPEMVALVMASY